MVKQNLNTGPQDALLMNNDVSLFAPRGYEKTAAYQVEYQTLDPINTAKFGATTTYKLHRSGDLLGKLDLVLKLAMPTIGATAVPHFLVNKFGYAMIDRVRFLVGANLIQEVRGEWLDIENQLFREPKHQYVDLIGDSYKKADAHAKPLDLTVNEAAAFDAPVTIDRGASSKYQASASTVHFSSEEPLMAKTNTSNTIQGRCGTSSYKTTTTISGANTLVPDMVPAPNLMPAFTGNTHVVHKSETDSNPLQTGSSFDDGTPGDEAHYGTNFLGNPAEVEFRVPLSLYFTKHPSEFLPLVAVAGSTDLHIEVILRPIAELIQHYHQLVGTNSSFSIAEYELIEPIASKSSTLVPAAYPTITSMQLFAHYVHLTAPEVASFMNKEHVRLFDQVQVLANELITMPGTNDGSFTTKTDHKIDLAFLHPVSELIITLRDPLEIENYHYFLYKGKPEDDFYLTGIDLVINNQSRHPNKVEGDYTLQRLVPFHHGLGQRATGSTDFYPFYIVPFAMAPDSKHPTGHMNFSKAATQQLKLDIYGKAGRQLRVDIYAMNKNWVHMKNGRAVVAFN